MADQYKSKGDSKTDVDAQLDLMKAGNPQFQTHRIIPFGRKAEGVGKAGLIIKIVSVLLLIIWVILVLT